MNLHLATDGTWFIFLYNHVLLSVEKTLMLEKIEGRKRKGRKSMRWLHDVTDSMDKFEQGPGVGDGQGNLACRNPLDH